MDKIVIPKKNIYNFPSDQELLFEISLPNLKYNVIYKDFRVKIDENTLPELKTIARYCKIPKYSNMSKSKLIVEINKKISFEL